MDAPFFSESDVSGDRRVGFFCFLINFLGNFQIFLENFFVVSIFLLTFAPDVSLFRKTSIDNWVN